MTNQRKDHNIWSAVSYDDAHAARAWLRELGFEDGILVPNDPNQPEGAIMHSEMLWPEGGRVMVHSGAEKEPEFAMPRGSGRVYVVVDDPDAVYARAQKLGARMVRELEDTDYGSRGFSIADPEGNTWSFGTYAG
ncbi:glyoxalase [Epidermidibacterium keratini]|uniref:Glyoxalase n=1 Tax=Epidermidibacterium keratini TaxID=1891644 RepID=A0A7L4YMA8_9ACTN|nr:VOC family protein [Epidermidibacterium keratini]QHB99948.1 glyoxalase [Epidermidibacterium keratini]